MGRSNLMHCPFKLFNLQMFYSNKYGIYLMLNMKKQVIMPCREVIYYRCLLQYYSIWVTVTRSTITNVLSYFGVMESVGSESKACSIYTTYHDQKTAVPIVRQSTLFPYDAAFPINMLSTESTNHICLQAFSLHMWGCTYFKWRTQNRISGPIVTYSLDTVLLAVLKLIFIVPQYAAMTSRLCMWV